MSNPLPRWINTGEPFFRPATIKKAEAAYRASYIGDFCVRTISGTWSVIPVAVFWVEQPPDPKFSNYLGLFMRDGTLIVCDGQSAVSEPIRAMVAEDGEVIYSRFRHDRRTSKDRSVTIDGGHDYTSALGMHSVQLNVVRDQFLVNTVLPIPFGTPKQYSKAMRKGIPLIEMRT